MAVSFFSGSIPEIPAVFHRLPLIERIRETLVSHQMLHTRPRADMSDDALDLPCGSFNNGNGTSAAALTSTSTPILGLRLNGRSV